MKIRKMGLVAAAVLASVCFLSISAWAADFTCTVVQTGPSEHSDKVFVMLTDDGGSFSNRWFKVPATRENQFLSIALTALASGCKVVVNTSGVEYAVLWNMYLQGQ